MLWVTLCLTPLLCGAQTVDFEVRATTLSNALGKLGRQTGRVYRPSKELAGEIVCMQIRRTPLAELESRLAKVLDAAWIDDGATLRLERSPQRLAELKKIEYEKRQVWLKELFDRKAKELALMKHPNLQAENFLAAVKSLERKVAERTTGGLSFDGPRLAAPASILANALVIDLGADAIAALAPDQVHVFSSSPTKAQKSLGNHARAPIRDFELAEARLADLIPANKPYGDLLEDVYTTQSESDPFGKVLLKVYPRGRIVSFNAHVYSKSGKQRSWGLAGTYHMGDDPWTREATAGVGIKSVKVRLSEGSAALDAIGPYSLDAPLWLEEQLTLPWSEVSQTQRKILLNPETIDPLSMHVTDACLQLAAQRNENLIAYLSDDMVRAARMATKDDQIDLAHFQAIAKSNGTLFKSSENWLEIKPESVLAAAQRRMPRAPLGKLLRQVVATGFTDLEPLCRFHYESENRAFGSVIVRMYRNALKSRGFPGFGMEDSHGPDVYFALGSLSPSQWGTLRQGGFVPIGRMPNLQRSVVTEWMSKSPYLETDPAANVPDLFKQPTEFAPQGLPANAVLSCTNSEKLVLRSVHKITKPDGSTFEGSIEPVGRTADEMTRGFAKGGYYKSVEHFVSSIRNSKFEFARRRDISFRLLVLPTHWIDEKFVGVPQNPLVAEFDKLPEDIRKEIVGSFERHFRDRGTG